MSAARDLNEALTRLQSGKVKERTEAVELIQQWVQNPRKLAALDKSLGWNALFQPLFATMVNERNDYVNKPAQKTTNTAAKRLEELAQLVHVVSDKACELVEDKVAKSLVKHFSQIVARGGLPALAALAYLRALKTILRHSPHLEHLKEKQWMDLLAICFAVFFGERVKDGEVFMDQQNDLDFARRESYAEATDPAKQKLSSSQEDFELLSCIECLVRSKVAPVQTYSRFILFKLLQVLAHMGRETSLHLPTMAAVNVCLERLELNEQRVMCTIAPLLWKQLIFLWETKSTALKEQLVIAALCILPFIRDTGGSHKDLDELFSKIVTESSLRWKEGFDFTIDTLSLRLDPDPSQAKIFSSRTLGIGEGFTERHAIAWLLLELASSLLVTLNSANAALNVNGQGLATNAQETPAKRRKRSTPLVDLLESLRDTTRGRSMLIWRLQTLLFFTEQHWDTLELDTRQKVVAELTQLLHRDETDMLCWTFCCLASIVAAEMADSQVSYDWSTIWSFAVRRLSIPHVDRCASHIAILLLGNKWRRNELIHEWIHQLSKDIAVQGPNFPSACVCRLLRLALDEVASDVQLLKTNLCEKCFLWLSGGWHLIEAPAHVVSFSQERHQLDPLSSSNLAELLCTISGLRSINAGEAGEAFTPDCHATLFVRHRVATSAVRSYALDCKISTTSGHPSSAQARMTSFERSPSQDLIRRISAWLQRMVRDALASSAALGDSFWTQMDLFTLKRVLDLAVTSMLFLAAVNASGLKYNEQLAASVTGILADALPHLPHKRVSTTDIVCVFDSLEPLLLTLREPANGDFPILLRPGLAAGIASGKISTTASADTRSMSEARIALSQIWSVDPTKRGSEALSKTSDALLAALLPSANEEDTEDAMPQTQKRRDDPFDTFDDDVEMTAVKAEIKVLSRDAPLALARAVEGCLRAIATSAFVKDSQELPVICPASVIDLIESLDDGEDAMVAIQQLSRLTRANVVSLGLGDCERLLGYIGNVLVTEYRFALEERAALVGLDFLYATVDQWSVAPQSDATEQLGDMAREFCAWYTETFAKSRMHSWQVRLRFSVLLEAYLRFDGRQQHWSGPGDVAYVDKHAGLVLPSDIIAQLLTDSDYCVRVHAATATTALFDLAAQTGIATVNPWTRLISSMIDTTSWIEGVQTQILVNANIIIASAERRRSPYLNLLDLGLRAPDAVPHIKAALQGVVASLGLSSLAHLFGLYAMFVQYRRHADEHQRRIQGQSQIEQHPGFRDVPLLAGVDTASELQTKHYQQIVPVLSMFDHSRHLIKALADSVQLETKTVLQQSYPGVAAISLVRSFALADSKTAQQTFTKLNEETVAAAFGNVDAQAVLVSVGDQITSNFLFRGHSEVWDSHNMANMLRQLSATEAASLLERMFSAHVSARLVESMPPMLVHDGWIPGLLWFSETTGLRTSPDLLFGALQHIFHRIDVLPFLDWQKEPLYNLSICLCICVKATRNSAVLALLSSRFLSLYASTDLLHPVLPMLRWTLSEWANLGVVASHTWPELWNALLEAVFATNSHLAGTKDESNRDQLQSFATFLDKTFESTGARVKEYSSQLRAHLDLVRLLWSTSSQYQRTLLSAPGSIARLVGTVRTTASLIPLCQKLAHYAQSGSLVNTGDLWWIINNLSNQEELNRDDASALVTLITASSGEIERPGLPELSIHVKTFEPLAMLAGSPKAAIALSLLEQLVSSKATTGPLLLRGCRAILSTLGSEALSNLDKWTIRRRTGDLLTNETIFAPREPLDEYDLANLHKTEWQRSSHHWQDWLTTLSLSLLSAASHYDEAFLDLGPAIKADAECAAQLLPHLIHFLLETEVDEQLDTVRNALSTALTRTLSHASADKRCWQIIIDIVTTLRRREKPGLDARLADADLWLDLPFSRLSEVAIELEQPFTALLFLELAHDHGQITSKSNPKTNPGFDVFHIVSKAYERVDEPDGAYGKRNPDVRQGLVSQYRRERDWQQVFAYAGAAAESHMAAPEAESLLIKSVGSLGLASLASTVRDALGSSAKSLPPDDAYEFAWRASDWSLPNPSAATLSSSANLFKALRSIHVSRNPTQALATVEDALFSETRHLARTSLNRPAISEDNIATILALAELKRWCALPEGERRALESSTFPALADGLPFVAAEKMLSTRISVLHSVRQTERENQIGDQASIVGARASQVAIGMLTDLCRRARLLGLQQVSLNAITAAHQLALDLDIKKALPIECEFAEVLWSRGESTTAIQHLESTLSRSEKRREVDDLTLAANLARLGDWYAKARLKSALDIVKDYFDPAVDIIEGIKSTQAYARQFGSIYGSFAVFADQQYEVLKEVVREMSDRVEQYAQRKRLELTQMERVMSQSASARNELSKKRKSGDKSLQEDEASLERKRDEAMDMIIRALQNYGQALTHTEEFDDKIFRYCALWLAEADNEAVVDVVKVSLETIPTYKFVFLAHQLSARMTAEDSSSSFMTILTDLVTRVTVDHPFQCLLPVHGLRDIDNGSSSQDASSSRRRSGRQSDTRASTPAASRSAAAEQVIERVRASGSLGTIVAAMETMCNAARHWALEELEKKPKKKRGVPVPSSAPIMTRARDLPIPPLTLDVPVDKTAEYSDVPKIKHYKPTFDIAGGNSRPKVMTCVDENGKEYGELFKKADDTRQDAVMEQVFTLMNMLLSKDSQTTKRKLRIRTYKVVPLQNIAGVIEHVGNTKSFGDVVGPLYQKQGGPTSSVAMQRMKEAGEKLKKGQIQQEQLVQFFKALVKDMPPVFRHAFYQRHKTPSLWFEYRLNYARSVATTSIGGHVLGLGDRHASNILMDEDTGELVHIDLGIAFDQGTRLAIPEQVPFRLTQNIIDGFGQNGVNGVFRRCAEQTLRVLRGKADVILMILEVFKHDPLQQWALSAEMAKHAQGTEDGATLATLPDDADRALAIVAEKLDNRLSIEQNINELIQRATDDTNLASIFHGWQPYL